MLLLGIDVGTSSIKVAVVDAATRQCLATASYPDTEVPIIAPAPGWAEQSPEGWWDHVKGAILKAHASGAYDPEDIGAIGIAYQMHGLVVIDKEGKVLRNAIIWCDSRAVATGEKALQAIGPEKALSHLLNSPGNFTASKLGWVKEHEPDTYKHIDRIMLPGDYIAYRLTGEVTTSISALSEGIFWDFAEDRLSKDVMGYFGFDPTLIPEIQPVFSNHGQLKGTVARELQLKPGIPVTYKAGDQPNNALSLNVLKPGEVAATAGTSGVIYGVTDALAYDPASRVNTFAHVNYSTDAKRLGVLLCINGTGILNRWVRDQFGRGLSYTEINKEAASIPVGSEGISILPFGNGAERMLGNRIPGAQIHGLDLNVHRRAHLFRAAQEGIAFSFRYGLDILKENGMHPKAIRAGKANLFLSEVFTDVFVQITGVPLDLYQNDGSVGSAMGAGIGVKAFASEEEAFAGIVPVAHLEPRPASARSANASAGAKDAATGANASAGANDASAYEEAYQRWKKLL
jgi:xylulokinase